jgi:type II secretory pathway pseudopilin PulG
MKRTSSGFTLAELAIVTVIVGLLLGGLLVTLSTQIDQRNISDTQKTLDLARDALIGYAIANGRLPCPAAANLTGVEAPIGGSTSVIPCTAPYSGFYPAVTVGLTPTDSSGYLLDSYGNRIRYAVTTATTGVANTFTTPNQMKTTGLSSITAPTTGSPYLYVCSTSTGMTTGASASCPSTSTLTYGAVAVIYSLGKNYATGGTGADESKNLDNDRAFIYQTLQPVGAANGEFDDLVTWLSPNVLYNRLIAAGAI